MLETLVILAILLLVANLYLSFQTRLQNSENVLGKVQQIEQNLRREWKESRMEIIVQISNLFKTFGESVSGKINDNANHQRIQLESFGNQLSFLIKTNEEKLDKFTANVDSEFKEFNLQIKETALQDRTELSQSLKSFENSYKEKIDELNNLQRLKFGDLTLSQSKLIENTENRLERMRQTLESKLLHLQEENAKKLEEMRVTVDEKLHTTLETRLGESFKLVSERLEQVQNGLGEMKNLAVGVGDLKKVLSNVKTRGTLGEIQLGTILEQILSPEQFAKNVALRKNSNERVEYAVKLPGRNENEEALLLPIDSKFPVEDYQRLVDGYEAALSAKEIEDLSLRFENAIKKNAKDIQEKYINPPITTDFAIMFLPTEGLYAEVLRRTGLFETLQRDYKITPVGPANLVAFLSSLQMGFRTLAVEKRSSEVWNLLGAVKTEFKKFGIILEKTEKQLKTVSNTIEDASRKTKTIERKLKNVQVLKEVE